jgi:hypothetical protein
MKTPDKLTKLRSLARPVRWRCFFAFWLVALILSAALYRQLIAPSLRVTPELGFSYRYRFGNAVLSHSMSSDGLWLVFAPAPAGSQIGGGLIVGSSLCVAGRAMPLLQRLFPAFQPMALPASAKMLNVELAGATGSEKFELKVRNNQGESVFHLGTDQYPISSELQVISIPLNDPEGMDNTAMGIHFDARNGIDAFVFGLGDYLDTSAITNIRVSRIWISGKKRSDSAIAGVTFFLVFMVALLRRATHLWHYDFSVFISYAHPSESSPGERLPSTHPATVLARELRNMQIATWIDKDGILASDEYCSLIAHEICQHRYLVVIGDERALRSQFVGIELGLRFHRRKSGVLVDRWKRWFGKRHCPLLDTRDIVVLQSKELPHVQQMLLPYQYIPVPKDCSWAEVALEVATLIYWGVKPEATEESSVKA